MTHDVRQWLAEIKTLQQKLAEAHQERNEAYESAANWRKLYETEAQQRRIEANLEQQTAAALKAEIQELRSLPQGAKGVPTNLTAIQQAVEELQPPELKEKLVEALTECDRLAQSLKGEQSEHAKTRKSLTTALGDTVDLLTKERTTRKGTVESTAIAESSSNYLSESKTPSLELPLLD